MEMRFRFDIMRGDKKDVEKQVKEDLNKMKETFTRHLDRIKAVYEFCETIAEGPLWTFCGGGMQLQQFYGDDNGYICILYLDMENPKDNNNTEPRIYSIVIQNKKYEKKFKNFKHETMKVR